MTAIPGSGMRNDLAWQICDLSYSKGTNTGAANVERLCPQGRLRSITSSPCAASKDQWMQTGWRTFRHCASLATSRKRGYSIRGRAGCSESCTSGSEGGVGKRTGRLAVNTAPVPLPYRGREGTPGQRLSRARRRRAILFVGCPRRRFRPVHGAPQLSVVVAAARSCWSMQWSVRLRGVSRAPAGSCQQPANLGKLQPETRPGAERGAGEVTVKEKKRQLDSNKVFHPDRTSRLSLVVVRSLAGYNAG